MEEDAVRWSVKVSRETDLTLRTFLGAQGMKKGDLSRFIEEAVRWRVFHRIVQDIKSRNTDTDPDVLQAVIDEAVSAVRSERPHRPFRGIKKQIKNSANPRYVQAIAASADKQRTGKS